jgi:hypothetical protein
VRGNLKWVVRLAGFVVATLLLGLAWEFFENSRKVSQAESLLVAFGSLKVGQSTADDIDTIVSRNGIETRSSAIGGVCGPTAKTRRTVIESRVLNWLGYRMKALRVFGNRAWWIEADFVLDRGKLCYAEYSLRTFDGDYSSMVTSRSVIGTENSAPAFRVSVDIWRNVRRIRTQTNGSATEQEHRHSVDFDLTCLSRLGGCRSSCEVMPWAWSEYQKEAKEYGWNVPIEEPAEFRCRKR